MAIKTYRFRLTKPIDDAKLAVEVGFAATSSIANAGGVVVDVSTDEAFSDDLKEAMARRGYDFVEVDPATTAPNAYADATANPFINKLITTAMDVPADKTLVLDDPELSLTGGIDLDLTSGLVLL